MPSYQYRKCHCGDKTVVGSSYLHNGISYASKMASLYWTNPQISSWFTLIWSDKSGTSHMKISATLNWMKIYEFCIYLYYPWTFIAWALLMRVLQKLRIWFPDTSETRLYLLNRCSFSPWHRPVAKLTHLNLDKMAAISQTIFSDAFSLMKSSSLWFKFHETLFLVVQLTITQHWFKYWLGDEQAASHYLNQCWSYSLPHICVTRGRWLKRSYWLIGT